jgi:membrane protease YdiL (CAAX protease family)
MNKLTDWIKQHQVAAFFIITFAITWGLGSSYGAVMKRDEFLWIPLVFVSICGPALAGIIVTAISNPRPGRGIGKAQWTLFLAALLASVMVFLAHHSLIEKQPLSVPLVGLILVSVIPVAFVISAASSRIPAVSRYVSTLIRLRGVWGWSLLALVLIPALFLLSFPIRDLLAGQPLAAPPFTDTGLSLVGLIAVKFLYQMFFFNATGEEVGWRGFALPRLQTRTSPLVAALIIAVFWPLWHLFLWQAEGRPVLDPQYWIAMYIGHGLLSLFIVWFYNRAGGSILVAGIAHAAMNTIQAFAPLETLQQVYLPLGAAALLLIVVDQMWKKLPPEHPAVYRAA